MNFLRSPELDTVAREAVFGLPVSYARGQERDVSGLPDVSGATHGLRRGRGIHRRGVGCRTRVDRRTVHCRGAGVVVGAINAL